MKAIDLIKKLLRLHRSSNPHEADLAMKKAMEIAAKHNVVLTSVDPDEGESSSTVTHMDILADKRIVCERRYAAKIVENFFNVTTVISPSTWQNGKVILVGRRSDLEIANYVYGFLIRHFRWCWRHHRGRMRNRQGFMWGMYVGLHDKLQALKAPGLGNELALSHGRYLESLGKKIIQGSLGQPDLCPAVLAGVMHGRNTEIRPGITAPSPAQPALPLLA